MTSDSFEDKREINPLLNTNKHGAVGETLSWNSKDVHSAEQFDRLLWPKPGLNVRSAKIERKWEHYAIAMHDLVICYQLVMWRWTVSITSVASISHL